MELSISGLARLTGKSERTIARWLKNGPLADLRANERGMYEVSDEKLLDLRPQDESTVILDHLIKIEKRLEQLTDIEQRLAAIEEATRAGPKKQIGAPKPAPVVTTSHERVLPLSKHPNRFQPYEIDTDGLVSATAFAKQHFPSPDPDDEEATKKHNGRIDAMVSRRCEKDNRLGAHKGNYLFGRARARFALDADGRAYFYEVFSDMAGFQRCDDCPHSEESPSSFE